MRGHQLLHSVSHFAEVLSNFPRSTATHEIENRIRVLKNGIGNAMFFSTIHLLVADLAVRLMYRLPQQV
jgi:hypothetical protein